MKKALMRGLKAKLARLYCFLLSSFIDKLVLRLRVFNDEGVNFKSIIGVVVYIAVIPLITELLEGLSTSLSGTSATLLSSIIGLVPLILVMKVIDKLDF